MTGETRFLSQTREEEQLPTEEEVDLGPDDFQEVIQPMQSTFDVDMQSAPQAPSRTATASSGRKMQYLFMAKQIERMELGCGECALVSGVKTTKELLDAGFKMPKMMREMAHRILFKRSGLIHELCLIGYYVGIN